jgi:hypothetical protein
MNIPRCGYCGNPVARWGEMCDACQVQLRLPLDDDDYDADELGLDPEEDFDA